MNMSQDDGERKDVRKELSSSQLITIEQLVRVARFPIYGLVGNPTGLVLKAIGYSTVPVQANQDLEIWQSNKSQVPWQVALHFEYPVSHQSIGRGIELYTTDMNSSPIPAPALDDIGRSGKTCYSTPDEVLPMEGQATSFIIERFPLLDRTVVATMEYSPNVLKKGRLIGSQMHHAPVPPFPQPAVTAKLQPANPAWSFTLRDPNMWMEGGANGWTQHELIAVLGHVGIVSQRPDVLAQYHRELLEWKRHLGTNSTL